MRSIYILVSKLLLASFVVFSCSGPGGGFAPSLPGANVVSEVAISPTVLTLAVSNLFTFTASGGTAPYIYSIQSGGGSILSTTGAFTAPGVAGTTVVRVTDAGGKFSESVVTTNPALTISPTSQSLSLNATQTFTGSGGVPPLVFSLASGAGTVNASTGVYTAPNSAGSATVRVTDGVGNTASATVSVFSVLGISPASATLAANNQLTLSAAGGTGPYTFSVFSGTGVINASTGVYTAPVSAGIATVRVTDSVGAVADASITINNALQISPASQTTLINSTITFSETGGVAPFTYSIVTGTGVVNASTGVYTAPASNGTATVRVTDSIGNTSNASVTVTTTMSISPTSSTIAVNNTQTFSVTGGTGPYTFSRVVGTGTINASTGVYTAPVTSGSATVRVTDSLGATADATVTVNAALAITPTSQTMGINGTLNFSASGGVVPYTYSIASGTGSINSATGAFTAPASPDTAVVRVTDSYGNFVNATVTINAGLSISPASTTLAVNNTATFTASSGTSPYTFSVFSGGGSINASTGVYTAPVTAGTAVVRVTDNLGATTDASVTINAALAIVPATKTLAVNNVFTFSATGGVSPYTYSVAVGGGVINASTGAYTAPAAAGTATVRVTDGKGNVSDSAVTINAALAISPLNAIISSTGSQTYSATGGVSPYTFSIVSGPGAINASTGVYTASSAGSVTIRVTDSLSNTSSTSLTVNGPLAVSPTTAYVVTNSDLVLSPSGGVAPYTFSQVSGVGVIDIVTGVYTAPATTGSAVVRTTDSATPTAATVDTSITVYNPLTLSPLTLTIAINSNHTFTASGGVGALTFSRFSGTGVINASTGVYTSGAVAGTDIIQVKDTIGNVVEATVTVVSQLTISPPTLKLPVFSTVTFTSVLGSSPYTYSIFAGTGTINSSTGLYTAPSVVGTGTARVTDSITNTSDAMITHIEPVQIKTGANHSCIRYNDGSVKCFGDGAFGQLGHGETTDLADVTTELGGNLPFVKLGTGRTATDIRVGYAHSCALLDNATIKCWGQNTYGQLGIGSTANAGDGANEMGDNLPAVNLGAGRTATQLFAFGYVTCAKLDNGVTKCFGRNSSGQLGLEDTVNRGTTAAQMGDSLPAPMLGAGRSVIEMSGGLDFTCALLDNSTVKCYGANRYGQLGQENTLTLGDSSGEMTSLAAVNLGTGLTATDIGAGYSHVCAVLNNGTAKCWGRNFRGQLGHNSTANLHGNAVGDMGDNLPAIPFTTFTPVKIYGGNQMSCAINATGGTRCWGQNSAGQLLIGSIANMGDGNNEMQSLANVNFGTGVTASAISVGYFNGCALMTNKRIKCWGGAANGSLGNGTITPNLGDIAGETGDGLPFVNH